MKHSAEGIVFIRPGDLHLTSTTEPNFISAVQMVRELNDLVKPDFVQFAGDNVQESKLGEFKAFSEISTALKFPWHAMPGDHDLHEDDAAEKYLKFIGETYSSFVLNNYKFIRLHTIEARPVGFSDKQLDWFESELESAEAAKLKSIIFQHHYPYKVCETYEGPGITRWRNIVNRFRPEAILCGHTHYGQIANDGINVSIATRSIGEPEGGKPGYHIFYADSDNFACTFREIESTDPIILIKSPRAQILTKKADEICSGPFEIEALVWDASELEVHASIDNGERFRLEPRGTLGAATSWALPYKSQLKKGIHRLMVEARTSDQRIATAEIEFVYDETGRYTAQPMLDPAVELTKYC